MDHQVVLAAASVAIYDLICALMPSVAGNGILHQIMIKLGMIAKPQQ